MQFASIGHIVLRSGGRGCSSRTGWRLASSLARGGAERRPGLPGALAGRRPGSRHATAGSSYNRSQADSGGRALTRAHTNIVPNRDTVQRFTLIRIGVIRS